jgi:hypothetical protein
MKRLIIAALALLTIASTDPVADTRQIMAGTVTTTKIKNEYLSGARDTTTVFQGALKAYKAVRAAESKPTVKCLDGTVVVAPGACPAPLVTPPPSTAVWTFCAHGESGETCYLKAPANVRYGAQGKFITKAVTSAISCDVTTFAFDPIVGVPKDCETDGQVGTAPPPPVVTPPPPIPVRAVGPRPPPRSSSAAMRSSRTRAPAAMASSFG